MEEQLEQQRQQCLYLCEKLIKELTKNKEDAEAFVGGDIYRAYVEATESAIRYAKRVRTKIRNI